MASTESKLVCVSKGPPGALRIPSSYLVLTLMCTELTASWAFAEGDKCRTPLKDPGFLGDLARNEATVRKAWTRVIWGHKLISRASDVGAGQCDWALVKAALTAGYAGQ